MTATTADPSILTSYAQLRQAVLDGKTIQETSEFGKHAVLKGYTAAERLDSFGWHLAEMAHRNDHPETSPRITVHPNPRVGIHTAHSNVAAFMIGDGGESIYWYVFLPQQVFVVIRDKDVTFDGYPVTLAAV